MANQAMTRLNEIKNEVDNFILDLYEKNHIAREDEIDYLRPMLEDFVLRQVEDYRAGLITEMKERMEIQLEEAGK